jgi:mono/diheme cytochrome c family protein
MYSKNKSTRISNPDVDVAIRSNSLEPVPSHFVRCRMVGLFTVLAILSVGSSNLAAQKSSSGGGAAFKTNCATCHGPDGSSDTPTGKSMNAPDLRSAEIQKLSDMEIATVISDGKNAMPPFKNLSKEQINSLVKYIRGLASKK